MCKRFMYLVSFVFVLCQVSNTSADLIAHWKFEDGQGTTVTDSSGNEYHGTIFDGPQWVDGYDGGALNFSGGGYVAIDKMNYTESGLAGVTVCAWIRTSSSATQYILSFDRNEYYRLEVNGSGGGPGQIGWDVWTSSGQVDYGSVTRVDDAQWHHVCGVFDNGTLTIYIDGNAEPSATGGDTWGRGRSTRYGFIGANSEATEFNGSRGGGNPVDGDLDDLRVYDTALSQAEIRILAGHIESYEPDPEDGAIYPDTWASLSWMPGPQAISHDTYFSDNFDDVNDGAVEAFRGNQETTILIVGFPGYPFPDGLAHGTTYYWRVDDVTADGTKIKGDVWSFWIPPIIAYDPVPADGEPAEPTDVILSWFPGLNAMMSGVYFGTDADQVNNATGAPPHMDTTYDPGPLNVDTDYYWRVDTFNGSEWIKGSVWNFKTRPEIPVTTDPNLVAWWKLDEGAGTNALDYSGHGNHGKLFGPEWTTPGWLYDGDNALTFIDEGYVAIDNISYSGPGRTEVTVCAWIRTTDPNDQYILSFDRNEYYRLQINGEVAGDGQVGWHVMTMDGSTEVQVDYGSVTRVDDGLWHHVCGVFERGKSTIFIDGLPEPSTTGGVTFGIGDLVRFGFMGANSEATEFDGSRGDGTGITGDLSDIRVYDKALTQDEILQVMRSDPLMAWDLRPTNGRILEIDAVSSVSWRRGDQASQHDVYFGVDTDAVASVDVSDTSDLYRGRQNNTSYTPPEGFDWGKTYYWRVDELNNDGTITKGRVRAIKIANYLIVDDFEDYNDYPPDEIWNTWIDGYGTTTNGATAGYPDPDFTAREHYVETTIVHSGRQAMPLFYDNNLKFSEAQRTFTSPRDWTKHGVEDLLLWYVGDPCNVAESMYVAIANSGGDAAIVYHDDPNLVTDTWTEWAIPLQAFADQGINLTNVNSIAIGFGTRGNTANTGGSGVVYFDDIRLYRPAVPVVLFEEDFENLLLGPNVDEALAGEQVWTDTPPTGWSVDESGIAGIGDPATDGMTEWAGWAFADKEWWIQAAEDQDRSLFELGIGTVAIADPDEWDDADHPEPNSDNPYDTWLTTPAIDISGIQVETLQLKIDSSWRPEFDDDYHQTANITASFDGGEPILVMLWESDEASANYKPYATNETVTVDLHNPTGATSVVLTFGLFDAGNDWWWAIDNIEVSGLYR